eukprot:16247-Heterococcus_DN1.PRE.9
MESSMLGQCWRIWSWQKVATRSSTWAVHRRSRQHRDLLDADDHYVRAAREVVMDMPGIQKEDVNISVDDKSNTLTVTTERKEQSDRDEAGCVTRERSWGKSVRSMALPNTADLQNAAVELKVSQHPANAIL